MSTMSRIHRSNIMERTGVRDRTAAIIALACLLLSLLAARPAAALTAQEDHPTPPPSGTGAAEPAKNSGTAIQAYIPPLRGAPGNRVGGGTRGAEASQSRLLALVPDHTGFCSTATPTISWYLSEATSTPLQVVINDETTGTTLASFTLPAGRAGLGFLDLATTPTRLQPGVDYTFFIIMKVDPDEPSRDICAGGHITYAPPAPEVMAQIRNTPGNLVGAYAQAGYWFDAIKTGIEAMRTRTCNAGCIGQLRDLFNQAGLQQATTALAPQS